MTTQAVDFGSAQRRGTAPLVEDDVQLSNRDVDRALRVMKRVLALRSLKRRLLGDGELLGSETLAIVDALERLERENTSR